MPRWKEGDRVRIVERPVTEEDRKANRYFDHMAGLIGVVQNVYAGDEVAVKVDLENVGPAGKTVHKVAVERMREKFLSNIGEEQKKTLTAAELNFDAHYMLLVRGSDLEKPA
jgi:hypothetical protein